VTELSTAVLYLRVSTKEQAETGGEAEGYSIPAQREACLRKAMNLKASVLDEFVDRGESARSADRPELQRLLAFVAANPVRYVIVHKVDRLARNRYDDVQITVALKAAGCQLVSCTESIDDTPSGMLLHGIMSSIAEFYSRNLANEVIKGSTQKAKNGGTVGKAPTGYLNHRLYEQGREIRTVIVDPERGPLMRQAFELYATGQWTIRNLLEELTKRGLTGAPTPTRPAKPLTQSNLHRLLRHPYYKGIVRYRGVEYPGKHQPLVSPALWQRVQEVLDAQNYAGEKTRVHPHYLKGSVYCGTCRARLIVHHARGRRGGIYPYFVCLGRQQKRTDCTQRAMPIDVVEALVEQHYRTIQPFAGLVQELRVVIVEELTSHQVEAARERERVERRVRRLEAERQKLLDAYYAEAIDTELLKREQGRILSELTHTRERLAAAEGKFETLEANLDQALALAGNWYQLYLGAGPKERRLMNQAIFERLYVFPDDTISHDYAKPFALLLGEELEQAATARYFRRSTGGDFDREWSRLSAKWAAELAASTPDNQDPRHGARVGGSNELLLVGAEGLEPPTSAL
jgi:site-specific DNA recombinase